MILDRIIESTIRRVASEKTVDPPSAVREKAFASVLDTGFPFERALRKERISFICEVKKASPSKGMISEDFQYLDIAHEYECAGADAVSVLTEPEFFRGDNRFLTEISSAVRIPTLRKDFVVDIYQVHQARILGASAVLLICSVLDDARLTECIDAAHALGMSALVEAHDETEVARALKAGARIVGVNNRDLKTFDVDLNVSRKLRGLVPDEIIFVSESGISTRNDIEFLEDCRVDAVLVGEALMRSADKKRHLETLRGRT
jgi:indole-3-glycerol phosphate synthase